MFKCSVVALCGFAMMSTVAVADTWTLDGAASNLAFGSVKKDRVGEVHSFKSLAGTVSQDGMVEISIDLTSVETNIEIRNERMLKYVFGDVAEAKLMVEMDMEELNAIPVGGHGVVFAIGDLALLGKMVEVEGDMFVARLTETQVMVTTNDMVFLDVEDAGLNAGVDKLMELASLPSITRTAPVTVRLMFNMD